MIKLIKDVHENWSLKARIALAIGFFLGVIACGLIVHSELAKMGCKVDMSFAEYVGAGTLALLVFMVLLSLGSLIIFGAFSVPQAIKEWHYNWKLNASFRTQARKDSGENFVWHIKVIGATLGAIAGIMLTITVTGGLLGYVGWLIFC